MKQVLIVAHKDCMDGLASAYIMSKYQIEIGNQVEVKFCQYSEELDLLAYVESSTFDLIQFCDFSLNQEYMSRVCKCATLVEVFDHHKTAEPQLAQAKSLNSNLSVLFCNDRSGAKICYDYVTYYMPGLHSKYLELVYNYIQDRDLWLWSMPNSKSFSEGLRYRITSNDLLSFESFVDNLSSEYIDETIMIGSILQDKVKSQVDSKVNNCNDININGIDFKIINATENISELGNAICLKHNKPALLYFIIDSSNVACSLRSTDSLPDISIVAKSFGGGGHRNAAGFTINLNKLKSIL